MSRYSSIVLSLILLCLSAIPVFSVTLTVPQNEVICLYKYLVKDQRFYGAYVVSGFDETSVSFMVQDPSLAELAENKKGDKEGAWEISAEETGEHRVCFNNEGSEEVYVSVELTAGEKIVRGPVTAKGLDNMGAALNETFSQLKVITTNLNFQNTREQIHSKNLKGLNSQIQWFTVFKVAALIIIAMGQAYILTGFFKPKGKRMV